MANQKLMKLLDWRTFLLALLILVAGGGVFAQETPFSVEVIVPSARMRYGPGLEHSVQHYANQGHILTVLSVDRTSDAPSIWYNVRTPSGVETWIRSDLTRAAQQTSGLGVGERGARPQAQPQAQATALPPTPAGPVQLSGGTHPVLSDNLCNTDRFRRCQDGSDQVLWLSGYWAKDRYDKWLGEGLRLEIIYNLNPCRINRDCPSWEAWEQGRREIENLFNIVSTGTPQPRPIATQRPSDVEDEPTEIPPLTVDWVALTGTEIGGLPWLGYTGATNLFNPPHLVWDGATEGATLLGRFRYNGETIRFTCTFWHNAGRDSSDRDDFARVGPQTISQFPDDGSTAAALEALKCKGNNIHEDDVIARQWHIKIDRSYGGENEVQSVKWTLEGTYGNEPTAACLTGGEAGTDTAPNRSVADCKIAAPEMLSTYLSGLKMRNRERTQPPGEPGFLTLGSESCEGIKNVRSDRVTDYRHTCRYMTEDEYDLTLTFHVTRSKQDRGLPTPIPE